MADKKTRALCLRTYGFRDSSQIAVLFDRSLGKLRAVAHGAKNSKQRFKGGLEPLSLLETSLKKRRGTPVFTLAGAEVLDGFYFLRQELERLVAATYVLDFLAEMLPEEQADAILFDLAVATLERLAAKRADLRGELLRFEIHAFRILGIAPNLVSCVACGKNAPENARFDSLQGGLICPACPLVGRSLAVCAGTRATYSAMAPEAVSAPIGMPARIRSELRAIFDAQVEAFLSRPLKTRRHWHLFGG